MLEGTFLGTFFISPAKGLNIITGELLLPELVASNKVVVSKHYRAGHIYLIEMPVNMLVVLCYQKEDEEPLYSRAFFYGEKNKDDVLKQAKTVFKYIKESR